MNENQEAHWVTSLEATGRYRVLRRLAPAPVVEASPAGARRAVLLDVETTGLDPAKDEIIELAMVPFYYSAADELLAIGAPFDELREPVVPISDEVTKLTGIDQAMVAGRSIDPAQVAAFAGTGLVIAHNAAFDRRFVERFCPALAANPWACSMSEIDWREAGFESTKLAYLALSSGFFYDRHRAVHDCHAAIELLARPCQATGRPPLRDLLVSARRSGTRCWADNSPFEAKDILKARGYRWNGDDNGQPRAWWTDLDRERLDEEVEYLRREIYRFDAPLRIAEMTAFNRYSDRFDILDYAAAGAFSARE